MNRTDEFINIWAGYAQLNNRGRNNLSIEQKKIVAAKLISHQPFEHRSQCL